MTGPGAGGAPRHHPGSGRSFARRQALVIPFDPVFPAGAAPLVRRPTARTHWRSVRGEDFKSVVHSITKSVITAVERSIGLEAAVTGRAQRQRDHPAAFRSAVRDGARLPPPPCRSERLRPRQVTAAELGESASAAGTTSVTGVECRIHGTPAITNRWQGYFIPLCPS